VPCGQSLQHNFCFAIVVILSRALLYAGGVAGEVLHTREHLALEVLRQWEDIPGGSFLMPEYFETRSLYTNERPGEQVLLPSSFPQLFP